MNYDDPTWRLVDVYVWTVLEDSVGITSACLPTMREYRSSLSSIIAKLKPTKDQSLDVSLLVHQVPNLLARKIAALALSVQQRLNSIVFLGSRRQAARRKLIQKGLNTPGRARISQQAVNSLAFARLRQERFNLEVLVFRGKISIVRSGVLQEPTMNDNGR